MSGEPNFYRGNIPYGKGEIEIRIPRRNFTGALMPHYKPGANESAEITRAIQNPIGTKRLKEIAMGRKNAAIVVNVITRPTATYKGGKRGIFYRRHSEKLSSLWKGGREGFMSPGFKKLN